MQFTSYSTKIKNLSLVCAIFVVSIHLPILAVKNGFSYSCWSIVQGMASIAVPFFFLFSGYFLSAHFDEEGWWGREVGKRIKTILVPYVIWSSIALVNREVACLIRNKLLGAQADYTVNVFRWFGLDFTCMPGAYPLWYLRNLMLLVLASFLVKKYIDSFRWGGVFVLYMLYLVYCLMDRRCMFLDHGCSIVGLLYFAVGVACRRAKTYRISRLLTIISTVVSLLFLFLVARYGFENMKGLLQIGVPFMMVVCWQWITKREWNRALVSCAFPIYVMHVIFQPHVYSIVKHFHIPYLLGFVCQWTFVLEGVPRAGHARGN